MTTEAEPTAEPAPEAAPTEPEVKAPEAAPKGEEGESATPDGTKADGEPAAKPRKDGAQKRINTLTRQKHDALRETEVQRQRADDAEKRLHETGAEQSRPQFAEFDTPAKYEDAYQKWSEDQHTPVPSEPAPSAEDSALSDSYDNIAVQAEQADFHDVVSNPKVPITRDMILAASESEHAADILYHLGKNPEEAERLSNLSATAVMREVGRLEAGIEAGTLVVKAAPAQTTSSAPEPINPVKTGGKPNPSGLSDDLSVKEWRRRRHAQKFGK